jgi:hypothetical protein
MMATPVFEEATEKVAIPREFVVTEEGEIVSIAPRLELRVTNFPASGFPKVSFKVTLTDAEAFPSAIGLLGEVTTEDRLVLRTGVPFGALEGALAGHRSWVTFDCFATTCNVMD